MTKNNNLQINKTENDKRIIAIIKSRYDTMTTVDLETGMCERIYLKIAGTPSEHKITGDYTSAIKRVLDTHIDEDYKSIFWNTMSLEALRSKAKTVEESAESIIEYHLKEPKIEWVEEHVFFIRQNNKMTVHILARDITDKKQKQAADIQTTNDYHNIIDCLSGIYFAAYYIDITTQMCSAIRQKKTVEKILGDELNFNEAINNYANNFIHPDDIDEYLCTFNIDNLSETLSPEYSFISFEYRRIWRDKKGEIIDDGWVRATAAAAEFENKKLKTVLYVAQDITISREKKNIEHQMLKDACKAANAANEAKSEFLSRMSHDIRTPMNAIIGMTAIAGMNLDDKERISDCLNKINTASKHLLSLVNEVLDMSKIESGKVELTVEKFNLSDLTENFLAIVQPVIKKKNHNLSIHLNNVIHENIIGDPMRLQRVFVNILENAAKYTPAGGNIDILISEKPSRNTDYSSYEFVFSDNGIGMSEDYQKHIFEPFSRADKNAFGTTGGTGLGMPIAQNIIRMMNGNIEVESKLGEGSKFTVNLYLKHTGNSTDTLNKFSDLPVLVIDEDINNCKDTCSILSEIKMKGEWIADANAALEQIHKKHNAKEDYFAIILNMEMPILNGIELTKKIREIIGEAPTLIILSAYDWSLIEAHARMVGINGFISKPLFKSRLVCLFEQLTSPQTSENPHKQLLNSITFSDKHILLAEDNELNREIAIEFIQQTGASVDYVTDGKDVVQTFEESEEGYYDLIYMDIQMPIMNGYDATRAIRSLNRKDSVSIPIIAMTANAFHQDVKNSLRAGMNEHITKPLSMEQLIGSMQRWLH